MRIKSCRPSIIRVLCAASAFACAAAYGQNITTFAGGGFITNVPALEAYLGSPQGVAVDASGNLYIADQSSVGQNRIFRVDHATQILTVVAGGGPTVFSSQDGPALSVHIVPTNLVVSAGGNVLFLDSSMLRQLNVQQGTITTLAGQANKNGSTGDGGLASAALLNLPQQFCLDAAGNIYIVELAGYVRRIDAKTNVITTIAGNGGHKFSGDNGPATAATLLNPTGIAVDSSGNLYIGDSGDIRVREIAAGSGTITTIAGNGAAVDGGDGGSATKATFAAVGQLAIDSKNDLFVIDYNRVRRIASGTINTVAGNGTAGLSGDGGPATQAELNMPVGMGVDSAGDLYIADTGNRRIRLVTASSGIISTVAGTSQNGDGGLAGGAVLTGPMGLAVDSAGDVFIAETSDVRKVNAATGAISTIAGGGTSTQDGITALQAKLSPLSVAVDSTGNLFIGEPGLIRRVDNTGVITTIAGTGATGFSGDGGPAKAAKLAYVTSMTFDASGNLLFTDAGNTRLRQIDMTTGIISTVAGNGQSVFTGLGQSAANTGIGSVEGVAVDSGGNIYIGGIQTYFLLKISPAGAVSIAGGVGGCGYIGDGGYATSAGICQPTTVVLDATDDIYVGDTTCYCVRRIAADTGIIQTVAGNGTVGYTGDGGLATLAQFRSISSIAIFGSTLYIADVTANVVRAVTPDTPPGLPGTPSFSSLVNSATFQSGAIAPGELVTFYGHYMGPASPTEWTLGSNGLLTIPNAGIQVFFDDVPAPLVYISAGQVNAVAPYSVANGFSTIKITTAGGTVTNTASNSIATSPGIFPGAIVNQDGTLNSQAHPAPLGSYVTMYGTGLGQTTPAGVDASITGSTIPKQVYSVSAGISVNPLFTTPVALNVMYYGPAPGLAAGVCQINAQIPSNAMPGENFMQIAAGPNTSGPIPFWVK